MSMSAADMNNSTFFLCLLDDLLSFLLTFFSYHAVKFFIFPTLCQLRLFASRIFIACLAHTNGLVREIVMTHRVEPPFQQCELHDPTFESLCCAFLCIQGLELCMHKSFFSFSCYLS